MSTNHETFAEAKALVIIPTYNEADNLEAMVEAVLGQPLNLHILVVDDNSPDGTGQIAESLSHEHGEVHVMHRLGKMGLGTAYVAGFKWGIAQGYDYILEMDCDFSHDPSYLPDLIREMEHYDVVVGSRYAPGGGTMNWGLLRKLISAGGNLFARLILGLKVRDCTAGFKCYRQQVLQTIPWDEIHLQGYAFQVATIYYSQRQGYRINEVPIVFKDRRVGQSKMSGHIVLEAFEYVLRTRWNELFRRKRPAKVAVIQSGLAPEEATHPQ